MKNAILFIDELHMIWRRFAEPKTNEQKGK
jgi:hypothetical protein